MKVRGVGVEPLEAAAKLADLPREKPSLPALMDKVARLSQNAADEPRALRLFEQIVRLYPEDPMALNNAAWLLLTARDEKLRDPRRALPMARKAAELSGEDEGYILDTLAKALHDTGDIRGAARYARKAAERSPDMEEIVRRAEEYAKEAARSF